MNAVPARVLSIAGSDSSGGAGIQADIKTVTALGGYAMTAITAITVQDTTGVHGFHPVPPAIVADQICAVLRDIGADAIKTGMLVSAACVEAVADALAPYSSLPLVVDTVMIAKGGHALLDDSGIAAMKRRLFPSAALITPNAPEAARLTGIAVESPDDCARAGLMLRANGARAVLVKGGHIAGDKVTDVLVDETGVHTFTGERIGNPSTHGTGCTLASAIATGLAQGLTLRDAVVRGRTFVQDAIRNGLALGHGTGPVYGR
ncbi:MAG TPA: bifunctional hydroxymethylpyrimidine kinase/phosphomethylpyrimidine kinase [Micropepsaceae bacterium]|nr:bifunctional hydroxymethylpyrimidine kinase/phosphomethylpyrimidine kinase [Micropepsaceae bacterium]